MHLIQDVYLLLHHRRQLVVGVLREEADLHLALHDRFRNEHRIGFEGDLDVRVAEARGFQEDAADPLDIGGIRGRRGQRGRQVLRDRKSVV